MFNRSHGCGWEYWYWSCTNVTCSTMLNRSHGWEYARVHQSAPVAAIQQPNRNMEIQMDKSNKICLQLAHYFPFAAQVCGFENLHISRGKQSRGEKLSGEKKFISNPCGSAQSFLVTRKPDSWEKVHIMDWNGLWGNKEVNRSWNIEIHTIIQMNRLKFGQIKGGYRRSHVENWTIKESTLNSNHQCLAEQVIRSATKGSFSSPVQFK